ncbi:hypothetical protein [Mangrovibacterium diazotrophicum]|uniref:TonB-dependent receptor-like protein n=1 Tax=Mangrovibacterium diazotrophicum TaxID=1261403 RepID=A0A419VY50_9BACT|nr:hypothetical protein [Mangrovibacterium diazotrophicum]RKD88157.1 hypothetical protein BC643_3300 [Mangrovibacterium diazotrophicum]
MKNKIDRWFILVLIVVLFYSCLNKKEPNATIDNEQFVENIVQKFIENGNVKSNPLVILDGVPYNYDILIKEKKLEQYKDSVITISSLDFEVGKILYGDRAKNGVIIISSKDK